MKFGPLAMQSNLLAKNYNKSEESTRLSRMESWALEVQRAAAWATFLLFGPLMNFLVWKIYRLSVPQLKQLRKDFQQILAAGSGPMLICSNHLTLVDSVIQAVFFNSCWGYWWNFSQMAWNVPEKKNVTRSWPWRLICFLGKCIPVERNTAGPKAKKSLAKMLYVLRRGDLLSIFPEGRRSRSGNVEQIDFSYGPGQLLQHLPHARVLCVYMRATKGPSFSDFPQKGEEFYMRIASFQPSSMLEGRKKIKDLSGQIIAQLVQMEQEFLGRENLCR